LVKILFQDQMLSRKARVVREAKFGCAGAPERDAVAF